MQGKNRNEFLEKEFDYGTMLGSIIHNMCIYIQFFIHGYYYFNVRPRREERLGNLNIPQ